MPLLFWVFFGIVLLSGLFFKGCVISTNLGRKEKTVDAKWSLNLAFIASVFVLLLPNRILLFPEIQLTLGSVSTAFHMTSRSFFLAAMSVTCSISMAFPAWLENGWISQRASVIALAIWVLSLDLLEVFLPKMDLHKEGIGTAVLLSHFLVLFLCSLTSIMCCYTVWDAGKARVKLTFALLPAFFLCRLPHHTLYHLQMWLHVLNKDSSLPEAWVTLAFFLIYFSCSLDAIICFSLNPGFENHPQRSPGQEMGKESDHQDSDL